MRILLAPLAGVLAALVVPAAAAPPPRTMAVVNRDSSLVGAWVTQINAALAPANAAIAANEPKMQAIVAAIRDADSARAAAVQMRELLQTQRSEIARAQANLAAIPATPPNGARIPGIDITKVLTDAKTLAAQLLQHTDALVGLANAMEKGDRDAVQAALPVVARGGLLIIDGQATVYRNRQLLFPSDQPAHQVIGVTVALYKAMGIAQQAWLQAVLNHQPEEAATAERARLTELADAIAANARAGRLNLTRVHNALLGAFSHRSGSDAAQLVAKIRALAVAEEKMFFVGDDLERWARTEGQENEVVRTKPGQSQALRRLYAMEQQLVAIQRDVAAALAGSQ